MDEIIRIFTAGLIRHIINVGGLSPSIKREEKEHFDWIMRRNGCDIGLRNVRDNSIVKRKKL